MNVIVMKRYYHNITIIICFKTEFDFYILIVHIRYLQKSKRH